MEPLGDVNPQQVVVVVVELVSTWGVRVVGAVAVLLVGRWIAGRLRRTSTNALRRSSVDATLVPFVSSLVYYLILSVVVVAVLGIFGIPTASLIAVLGAAGLAVGLALQGTLSNFAAGVMLLLFRPFHVGDFVEVGGVAGSVQSVGVFTTELHTPDNVLIIVPNSEVFGRTIKNYAANDTRRNDLTVGWGLRFDLTRRIKEALEVAGCSIPFPQRDVHLIPTEQGGGPANGRAA